jgi:hypothetical protein
MTKRNVGWGGRKKGEVGKKLGKERKSELVVRWLGGLLNAGAVRRRRRYPEVSTERASGGAEGGHPRKVQSGGKRSSQPPPSKDGQGSKKTEETSGTRARKSGIKIAPD